MQSVLVMSILIVLDALVCIPCPVTALMFVIIVCFGAWLCEMTNILFEVFLNLLHCIAGWTIERSVQQGSQCRTEIVFGSGAGDGNIFIREIEY